MAIIKSGELLGTKQGSYDPCLLLQIGRQLLSPMADREVEALCRAEGQNHRP